MKVCFVGIGQIAKRHIRNLHKIYKELKRELIIDALRREDSDSLDFMEDISKVFFSIKDLPKDYDTIFLTNPTEYHAETLLQLHEHGKHFFIEKPITSISTIDKLKLFKERKNSIYYVACPLRYSKVIQYLKKEINPETVKCVRCISSSYLPEWRPGIDYRESYSARKDMGGGVAADLIHEWDYISFLFGIPSEVKSFTGKVSNLEISSKDYAIYIARYFDKMIAELHLDYFGRKTIRKIEIFTEEETIIGDLVEGEVVYLNAGKTIKLKEHRDSYQERELRYFLDMIDGKVENWNNISNALKVLKLAYGIIE